MGNIYNNPKEYVNGAHQSIGLQYFTFFILFTIVPLSILFLYYKALKYTEFQINRPIVLLITIAACIVFSLLLIIFSYWRKYWVIKIMTDETGITYYGFLKKINSPWVDVISIELPSNFLSKNQVKVTTRKGDFFFPFTMKEKNQKYPKLVLSWDWKWQYENGSKEPISPENCPLYKEIQNHLRK
jgi:hypothetical protein